MSDDIFNEENVPESNWFKFVKPGDKVSGVVLDVFEKEGTGDFPAQKVFVLKQKDGEEVNVGVSVEKDFVIQRTNKVRAGDKLGFKFEKEIPASKKGYSPAKSIIPFVVYTDEGDVVRNGEKEF